MPRMKRANFGIGDSAGSGGGAGAAERLSSLMESSQRAARAQIVAIEGGGDERDDHPDLANLEKQLNDEVDEDFFDDPRKFHTLHRVIDVLGMQLDQDRVLNLETNPAFKALKDQQTVVEEAIEHLAMIHCADLNGSVVQVGRVARQFHDAVTKVRCIRKQVKDIQETLGTAGAGGAMVTSPSNATKKKQAEQSQATAASAMSLRELWLSKLQCEATLTLLSQLDKIRKAPQLFDTLVQQHRLGGAVVQLSQALETMFREDVAQVQALHKIMEQLMNRKQQAEELVWDLLVDVVFLRTAVGKTLPSSSTSTASMTNPFLSNRMRFCLEQDLELNQRDDDLMNSDDDAMLFEFDDDGEMPEQVGATMVLPPSLLETEIDVEQEELRALAESRLDSAATNLLTPTSNQGTKSSAMNNKFGYSDPILALRTLADCVTRLRRLDDVERVLSDALEREVQKLVQREQARTFLRLEHVSKLQAKGGRYNVLATKLGASADLREFRRHLNGLISSFGNTLLRLVHWTQILRHKVAQEKQAGRNITAYSQASNALATLLQAARNTMEKHLKDFLRACLEERYHAQSRKKSLFGSSDDSSLSTKNRNLQSEAGMFSLGIIDQDFLDREQTATADPLTTSSRRATIMAMTISEFVMNVLFAKTTNGRQPQIRHALFFRKSINHWSTLSNAALDALAKVTGEDTSTPSYKSSSSIPALQYLDNVIQKELLPVLQEEAVNGTVQALERSDAFDPILDQSVYNQSASNEPQNIDMCKACDALYESTAPLFLALHRLPQGGEMYLPLVAVLEHTILTFLSRIKQQISRLTNGKTALDLIMDNGSSKTTSSFGTIMEKRKAYAQLYLAYIDGDLLENASAEEGAGTTGGLTPLSPPPVDTQPRSGSAADTPIKAQGMEDLDLVGGVEVEEQNLAIELSFVKQYLEFGKSSAGVTVCSDEELMKAACLAHSLLKLASLLDSRLKIRAASPGTSIGAGPSNAVKTLPSTRALREAIKTIKGSGLKMAKFCRADMLMQTVTRLSKVCTSSTIVARDAVRIPSSVNDLGEYMTAASDNLREAAGTAVTAYSFSNLEQYIPLCLIQTVRVIAAGEGILKRAPLTMNGIEALDRSGSVLYRDLKGATSFQHSFWDIELAAVSFERSASFMAMMELEMSELEAYYQANRNDFSEQDFELMFAMNGPRRKGDVNRYLILKQRLETRSRQQM